MKFNGKKLKELRCQSGMTMKDITVHLLKIRKYTRQAVCRWEQGLSDPPSAVIYELSQLFQVDIRCFFA